MVWNEEFDRVNQSDFVFVERIGERPWLQSELIRGVFVLHFDHPRDWADATIYP